MQKKETYAFLLRAAIPEVKGKDKLPRTLSKSNWIWDAVYRAHRDVLAGRKYVREYSECRKAFNGEENAGVNIIAERLYWRIVELCPGETLPSSEAIRWLAEMYPDVKLGAIQKLVNMTFKYLLILQAYGLVEQYIDIAECDCPLDSIILERLSKSHPEFSSVKWTAIDDVEVYEKIQQAIESEPGIRNRIMYDFKYWQD